MTAQTMRNLGREIVRAFEDRRANVSRLQRATRSDLHRFGTDRLRATRDQNARLRRSHQDLTAGVTTQLRQLHAGRLTMAGQQRTRLAANSAEVVQQERRRAAAARTWLAGVHSENAAVHDAWRNTTAQMSAKRSGATLQTRAEARPQQPVAQPDIANQDPPASPTGEAGEHLLAGRITAAVAGHPEGIRLSELERELGISRIQLGRVVNGLISDGKVQKRDLTYFAA